jgi:4a-hydroxytetrahydrobiopterin dehydratase
MNKKQYLKMKTFSSEEITRYLALHLTKWEFAETVIKRDLKFKNFVEAFSFMTAVALEAEKMDHHPAWSNVYNTVSIALNTHSAKGITQLDFDLADKIDTLFKNMER